MVCVCVRVREKEKTNEETFHCFDLILLQVLNEDFLRKDKNGSHDAKDRSVQNGKAYQLYTLYRDRSGNIRQVICEVVVMVKHFSVWCVNVKSWNKIIMCLTCSNLLNCLTDEDAACVKTRTRCTSINALEQSLDFAFAKGK